MPENNQNIPDRKEIKTEYESRFSIYENILHDFQQILSKSIRGIFLYPAIKFRIKSFDSYYDKLLRRMKKYKNIDTAFSINDIMGLRIVYPFQENLKNIEILIKENYEIIEAEDKSRDYNFKEFGYASVHYIIMIPEEILSRYDITYDLKCEVQLCTTLQDAWADVEHELVYKAEFTSFDEPLKRKLAALNANLTLSDILFQEILDYRRELQGKLKKRKDDFFKKVEEKENGFAKDPDYVDADIDNDITIEETKKNNVSINFNSKKSIDDKLMEALEAHNNNQFYYAIAIYSELLEINIPKKIRVVVYIHRGIANFAQSNYDNSILDFSSALEIDKDNHKAMYYRGTVHRVLQNYQYALVDLDKCIKLEPYVFNAYFNRAQVYFHLNDYPKALSDCELGLKIKPDSKKAQKFRQMVLQGMDLYNIVNENYVENK